MTLRIAPSLFLGSTLLVVAVVGVLLASLDGAVRQPALERLEAEVQREAILARAAVAAEDLSPEGQASRAAALAGRRASVFGEGGILLADSELEPGEVPDEAPAFEPPEVGGARADGTGTALRESDFREEVVLYGAAAEPGGPVVRLEAGLAPVEAAVAQVRRRILQAGGMGLLLAALLGLALGARLDRPLRRMESVARSLASGDLSARVDSGRGDEVGDLGRALDSLAESLRQRFQRAEADRLELESLIDSMAEGVLALHPDGTIRRANPAARRLFQLTGDPRGSPPEILSREDVFLELVERACRGETVRPVELSRGEQSLMASAEPLPNGGAVVAVLDITGLRRLQGARRDFVANVSHELKTPLTVIRGHSETLLDEELPEELRRRFTRSVHENAERLQNLLDDLLDLSRIESGGWTPAPETVDLETAAREAWEPFAPPAEERRVEFTVTAEPDAGAVQVDPSALRQILANLFSNALRYTPEGGRIEVRARADAAVAPTRTGRSPRPVRQAGAGRGPGPRGGGAWAHPETDPSAGAVGDGPWCVVEVSDTGSGIPSRHLDRVFERFYRVDPGRSREEGGTGLGLSIVRHLVERHGGVVEVESELDRGTTIRFTLPLAAASASA